MNNLKKLRTEKKKTQLEIAKLLNTTQSQYGKYENGKTKLSIENARILSEYFNVSVPYLLDLEENPKPPTRINRLIKQSGKKLKQISEESGVPYGALSSYNQGIRTPKKNNATRLAEYFNVSLPYLMGDKDDEPWFKKLTLKQLDRFEKIQHEKKQLIDRYKKLLKEELEILED